jgi:hypothetical protein
MRVVKDASDLLIVTIADHVHSVEAHAVEIAGIVVHVRAGIGTDRIGDLVSSMLVKVVVTSLATNNKVSSAVSTVADSTTIKISSSAVGEADLISRARGSVVIRIKGTKVKTRTDAINHGSTKSKGLQKLRQA